MVGTDAQDGVVGVEGSLAIDQVGADHRVEDVHVVHRMDRSLEVEGFEIGKGHDHHVGVDQLEERGSHRAGPDEERP